MYLLPDCLHISAHNSNNIQFNWKSEAPRSKPRDIFCICGTPPEPSAFAKMLRRDRLAIHPRGKSRCILAKASHKTEFYRRGAIFFHGCRFIGDDDADKTATDSQAAEQTIKPYNFILTFHHYPYPDHNNHSFISEINLPVVNSDIREA